MIPNMGFLFISKGPLQKFLPQKCLRTHIVGLVWEYEIMIQLSNSHYSACILSVDKIWVNNGLQILRSARFSLRAGVLGSEWGAASRLSAAAVEAIMFVVRAYIYKWTLNNMHGHSGGRVRLFLPHGQPQARVAIFPADAASSRLNSILLPPARPPTHPNRAYYARKWYTPTSLVINREDAAVGWQRTWHVAERAKFGPLASSWNLAYKYAPNKLKREERTTAAAKSN